MNCNDERLRSYPFHGDASHGAEKILPFVLILDRFAVRLDPAVFHPAEDPIVKEIQKVLRVGKDDQPVKVYQKKKHQINSVEDECFKLCKITVLFGYLDGLNGRTDESHIVGL